MRKKYVTSFIMSSTKRRLSAWRQFEFLSDESFRAKFGDKFNGMKDMPAVFDELISTAFKGAPNSAVCGLTINHKNLKLGKPALIPFQTKEQLTSGSVMAFFDKLHQSNEECDFESYEIESVIVELPTAAGKRFIFDYNKYVANHNRTILRIENRDDRCLTR